MVINGIEWKPVIVNGMNTRYIANELGNVMNVETGYILKPSPYAESGRLRLCLHLPDGTKKDMKIYRIIWEAFNGPVPKDLTIDHIDDDFNNNQLSNLQLLTASENIKKYYRNHPDKGFQKTIPDQTVHEFFKMIKRGIFYQEAAHKLDISVNVAKGYINGRRRKDIWTLYQPFPKSAWSRTKIGKKEKDRIKYLLLEGKSTREILKDISVSYDQYGINLVSRMRSELCIANNVINDDTWENVEKLIIDGKTNKEIYSILNLEYSESLARKITRKRNILGIPDKRFTIATKEEIEFMTSSIINGLSNREILSSMGKYDDRYYRQLCADLRYRKIKHDSTTIEKASKDVTE